MIGFALLYFIWKYYTELATKYGKNKWGYFFVGVVSYYGSTAIAGLLIGVYGALYQSSILDDDNSFIVNLIALPAGFFGVWGVYKLLEKRWKNDINLNEGETLDSDLIN